MFRKITDGFCLGLGFSLASVIVVSMVWSMYSHTERTQSGETSQVINDSAPSVKAELSRSELQQKECSLLIPRIQIISATVMDWRRGEASC